MYGYRERYPTMVTANKMIDEKALALNSSERCVAWCGVDSSWAMHSGVGGGGGSVVAPASKMTESCGVNYFRDVRGSWYCAKSLYGHAVVR